MNQQALVDVTAVSAPCHGALHWVGMEQIALPLRAAGQSIAGLASAGVRSRSRQCRWRKGESSGHYQRLIEARLDCDGDAVLLFVVQQGPACHTERPNCFYNAVRGDAVEVITEPAR